MTKKQFILLITFLLCMIAKGQYGEFKDYNNLIKLNYSNLNYSMQNKVIKSLISNYNFSSDSEIIKREKIINYMLDSIIVAKTEYFSLASDLILKSIRINEITKEQKNKLLSLFKKRHVNFYLIQLVSLLDDSRFIYYLNDILENNILTIKEKAVVYDCLVRLGDEKALINCVNHLKLILNSNENITEQEVANYLTKVLSISRKEVYDILFEFLLTNNDRIIIIGDYGGDPYGGDDNIYCTLSSYVIELLSEVVIDFPLKNVNYSVGNNENEVNIVIDWFNTNQDYTFKLWHPYYRSNYKFW